MKLKARLPFRRVAASMLGLVLAGFVLNIFTQGEQALAAVDINSIQLEAVLRPAVNGVYSAEINLKSPQEIRVGDTINLGLRSADKIKSFGIGWLESSRLHEQCEGVGRRQDKQSVLPDDGQGASNEGVSLEARGGTAETNTSMSTSRAVFKCAGAEVFVLSESFVKQGQVISEDFGVVGLDKGPIRQGDTVVPVVQTESGETWAWLGVPDVNGDVSVGGRGQVAAWCDNAVVKYTPPCLLSNFLKGRVGDTILGTVNSILAAILGFFNEFIHAVFSLFVGPGVEALLAIRTFTDEFAAPIFPAWKILRNLSNILFILAIIAIGVATIFRLGGWQAKDMLVRLIVGAIFINFSLVIAQTILGVADTVQNQFLPPNTGALRLIGEELFIKGKGLFNRDAAGNVVGFGGAFDNQLGTFDTSVKLLFGYMISFGSFIAFVALWFFLLIRTVALWILLMVSPLAYAAMALPLTRGLTSRWWRNFIKYAFMTPAVAFMINLTALIAKNQRDVIENLSVNRIGVLSEGVSTVMYAVVSQAVVIAFLFVSIKAASMFGAEGGNLVSKVSETGWRSAVGGMKTGTGYNAAKNQMAFWADQGKSKYLSTISKFAPKEEKKDEHGNTIQRKSGAAKRFVYDVLSGGAVTKARSEEGKALVSTAQRKVRGTATDYRRLVNKKPLTAAQDEEQRALNEKIAEYDKAIKGLTGSQVVERAEQIYKRGIKTQDDFAHLMSLTDRMVEDRNTGALMTKLGKDNVRNIEGLYAYGAKQGMNTQQLGAISQLINGKAASQGRLDQVVRYDTPMDAGALAKAHNDWVAGGRVDSVGDHYEYQDANGTTVTWGPRNQAYRDGRFGAKNEFEQAQDMAPATLFNLDKDGKILDSSGSVLLTLDNKPAGANKFTAQWARNFANLDYTNPATGQADRTHARSMVGNLSDTKRNYFRDIITNPTLITALDAEMAALGMPAGSGPGSVGRAIYNLQQVL